MRRILSVKFNESCRIHDEDYTKQELTKEEADKKFLDNMLEQAGESRFWRWAAGWYYWAADKFGGASWEVAEV
jgi:hypothetical protein